MSAAGIWAEAFPVPPPIRAEVRLYCRCEPFASCHSELKAKNLASAQDKLRVAIPLLPTKIASADFVSLAKTGGGVIAST